mmetsp:Transcript_14289/g.19894  ORF Transcript_14289/g.19894 Transcript_14289/m.19894 type:complete len:132 (+) Transcript_14289:827-1222(+)
MSSMWRNKRDELLKLTLKLRILRIQNKGRIIKLKSPFRLDKAKIYGFKRNRIFTNLLIKVRRRLNKRKARKGKIYGKISSHGSLKRKRNLSLKSIAIQKLKKIYKNYISFKGYCVYQDKNFKYYEFFLKKV